MLNSQNEWEEFRGPENVYDLEFIKEINGKEILFYRMCGAKNLLLVDNNEIEMPDGAGEIEDIIENDGNLVFLFRNKLNTGAEWQTGISYTLDQNNKWNNAISYPLEATNIHKILNANGKDIIYFGFKGILASFENNNWNVLYVYSNSNGYIPTVKSYNSNGKSYITIDGEIIKELISDNGVTKLIDAISLNSYVNNIKDFNGININYGLSILDKENNIFKFDIEGKKVNTFHEIKNGNEIMYSFDINGTSRIFTQEEFLELINITNIVVSESSEKIANILD